MLRLLQRFSLRGVVGAGVHQLLIEPQPVELVADIVVVMDVSRAREYCVDAATPPAAAPGPWRRWYGPRPACDRRFPVPARLPSTSMRPAPWGSPSSRSGLMASFRSARRSWTRNRPVPAAGLYGSRYRPEHDCERRVAGHLEQPFREPALGLYRTTAGRNRLRRPVQGLSPTHSAYRLQILSTYPAILSSLTTSREQCAGPRSLPVYPDRRGHVCSVNNFTDEFQYN
jgi:hypothetical protein